MTKDGKQVVILNIFWIMNVLLILKFYDLPLGEVVDEPPRNPNGLESSAGSG